MRSWRHLIVVLLAGMLAAMPLAGSALPMSTSAAAASTLSTIYWTDASLGTINRASTNGSTRTVLAAGQINPIAIALDVVGKKLYWAEGDGMKIRRANLDGTAIEDLVGSVGPSNIALDLLHRKLYWTDIFVTGKIQRSNLDGTSVEDVVPIPSDREGIALDVAAGNMYWTNRSFRTIERANLDGSGSQTLVTTGIFDPRGIALDLSAGKMYWTDVGFHSIQRANTDGSAAETIVTGLGAPDNIALDLAGGKMYWTDFTAGKVQRANLDGSAVEDLLTRLTLPTGLALGPGLDTTPPNVSCVASPSVLWPPEHQLVSIGVAVRVTDSESGPAGFVLSSISSSEPDTGLGSGDIRYDIVDFVVGTPDISGELRAERSGLGSGRVYTLTYTGFDNVGNSATCQTTVSVPHDQAT